MHDKSMGEPAWRTARKCEGGACVQIGIAGEKVLLRGSADPDGQSVAVSRTGWREFVTRVKEGDSDRFGVTGVSGRVVLRAKPNLFARPVSSRIEDCKRRQSDTSGYR